MWSKKSTARAMWWGGRSWEHLRPEDYPLHDAFERYHWPMTNAVSPGRDGKIILSLRSVSAVIAISRSSSKVLWRLGHDLLQQHCPSELENGNVLAFDNGIFGHIPACRTHEYWK